MGLGSVISNDLELEILGLPLGFRSQLLARNWIKEATARGSVAAARASRAAGGWLRRRWSGGGLRRRRGSARAGLRLLSLLWLNPRGASPFISNGGVMSRVSSSWASCTWVPFWAGPGMLHKEYWIWGDFKEQGDLGQMCSDHCFSDLAPLDFEAWFFIVNDTTFLILLGTNFTYQNLSKF